MRSYPRDSPQAAARIVALALIADGHLSRPEVDALDCCDALARMGIDRTGLQAAVHTLCEDLLATSSGDWTAACAIGPAAMASMLDEVHDPLLRLKVLQLCLAAVTADGRLSDGESAIVGAALARWGDPAVQSEREAA